jgi:hypothetical protein
MHDNAFDPPVARAPRGGRVRWVNAGRNPHNAVADDLSWSTEKDYGSIVMPAGASASVTYAEEGVYPYFCTFHGAPGGIGMAGVVVVGDAPYDASRFGRALEPVAEPTGITRRVPQDHPNIQAAVDAASPGDLVLVDRGVYREEVLVTTPSLVLRGVDRNEVVIDGEFVRGNGVIAIADGVAVENMTARNALLNGFDRRRGLSVLLTVMTPATTACMPSPSDGLFETRGRRGLQTRLLRGAVRSRRMVIATSSPRTTRSDTRHELGGEFTS